MTLPTDTDAVTGVTTSAAIELADRVSREFLVHHRMCPIGLEADGRLAVAVTDESLLGGLDDLGLAYGRPVVARTTSSQELDLLIARLTSAGPEDLSLESAPGTEEPFVSDMRDLANQAPVVRYVNLILRDAHEAGASDIHLESTAVGLTARYRIDGVLVPAGEPPSRLSQAVRSRVKLLADLDIAEQRRPQDGRIRVRLKDRNLDVRVSTVPTVHGESVVLRLLERGTHSIGLGDLGLDPTSLSRLETMARRPNGLIIATGPTGSGKTTTLYAALGLRSRATEKIITVEDPIEYALDGIAQVPVQSQTGVTFASMLRSILRQDPDVIFVGEMRDQETAELGIRAALTGHVVFSTLHTNDALGAIPRLIDLGIPPFLIAATLKGVLAQRLVRTICGQCRRAFPASPSDPWLSEAWGETPPDHLVRGAGCEVCRGTGYRGRTGVFELFEITDAVRESIASGPGRPALEDLARAQGMVTMRGDGWRKVRNGLTTLEEVVRVTQD